MNDIELTDLGNLAIDRCRLQVRRVMQLIESDDECAAVLIAIAVDMMEGAACMLHGDGRSESEAKHIAVANFCRALQMQHQRQASKH